MTTEGLILRMPRYHEIKYNFGKSNDECDLDKIEIPQNLSPKITEEKFDNMYKNNSSIINDETNVSIDDLANENENYLSPVDSDENEPIKSPEQGEDINQMDIPIITEFQNCDPFNDREILLEFAKRRKVPIYTDVEFEDLYVLGDLAGKGKFGKVYKVTPTESHKNNVKLESMAAKVIPYRRKDIQNQILEEIRILELLRGHDHVMNVIEVYHNKTSIPKKFTVISEYLEGVELFEEVSKEDFLTETEVIFILRQLLSGISFIHSHNIIHRDLKPENVMFCGGNKINSNQNLKIIDFGFAVHWDPNSKQSAPKKMVGTTIFAAPEIFRFEEQSSSTDMWSLGIIAYNLLGGITPFEIPRSGDLNRQLDDNEIISNIEKCQYDYSDEGFEDVSDDAKDFVDHLLLRNPKDRMSAEECLKHKWIYRDSTDSISIPTINRNRLVSLKRMKNFVINNKWRKLGLAIHSVSLFKCSINN